VNEDFKTVAELRNSVREDLEHKVEHQTDEEVRNAVMEQLIERNRFEVPQVAVEETMNARMKTLVRGLAAQGVDPKTLKIDWSALREQDRERATKEVRGAFILDRIAEAEKIEATDEDLDKMIEELGEKRGETAAQIKASLTKSGALDSLREQIRNRKVLDLVISAADLKIEQVEGPGQDAPGESGE